MRTYRTSRNESAIEDNGMELDRNHTQSMIYKNTERSRVRSNRENKKKYDRPTGSKWR